MWSDVAKLLDVFGQNLFNILACIIGLIFTLTAPFKKKYSKQKVYWSLFWGSLLIMFAYYAIIAFVDRKDEISSRNWLFNLVQLFATTAGNSGLWLIYLSLASKPKKKTITSTVLPILFITVFASTINFLFSPYGNYLHTCIFCSLFCLIGFEFRKIHIESSLSFIAYGILTVLASIASIIKDKLPNHQSFFAQGTNTNGLQEFLSSIPVLLVVLHFVFIVAIYQLTERTDKEDNAN